jgi:hypothetical protein
VELLPPAVQTELHDAVHQPDIVNGGSIGMPIEEFMESAWAGIAADLEEIPVGPAIVALERIDKPRKEMMARFPWNPT